MRWGDRFDRSEHGALFTKFRASGKKTPCSKSTPSFVTEKVALEFMTDDASEAEEMRQQWLAFDCVAEVKILDLPGWVQL
jgi:hypothetical protein